MVKYGLKECRGFSIVVVAICFFLGTTSSIFFSEMPSFSYVVSLFFSWFILLFLKKILGNRSVLSRVFSIFIPYIFGLFWVFLYCHYMTSWVLPHGLENKRVTVLGYIASIPKKQDRAARFLFDVEKIGKKRQKTRIQLSWYGKQPLLLAGDKWQLLVKLKRPHGWRNPGGFDYEKYLFEHRIRATGYVVPAVGNKLLSRGFFAYFVDRWRQHISMDLANALKLFSLKGVIIALTIGFKGYITAQQWQVFRCTGTSHLVAISGLHLGLIVGAAFWFFCIIWRLSPFLVRRVPVRYAATIFSLVIGSLYTLMAGASLPTTRALIMLAVFVFLLLSKRNFNMWWGWSIALLVAVLINPLIYLSGSFWLSFGAVALLIFSFSGRKYITKNRAVLFYQRWMRAQLVIALGLVPVLLFFFQQISLVSVFANFVAIPYVGFIVLPLSFFGLFLLFISRYYGAVVLGFAHKTLVVLWVYLKWLALLNWSVFYYPIGNFWVLVSLVVAILLLLSPLGFPGRMSGFFLCCRSFFRVPYRQNLELFT